MDNSPRYDLPWHAWRALHSALVSFVIVAPEPMQQALQVRLGGDFGFARFMLAVHEARALNLATQIDGNQVHLGVAVPVRDGADLVLCWLDQRQHGVELGWLLAAGRMRIDDELADLLREPATDVLGPGE
jgi:hypothetical protein